MTNQNNEPQETKQESGEPVVEEQETRNAGEENQSQTQPEQ